MTESSVGIRELRQNLSRFLDRVKSGEALIVTERGREVARLVPSGASVDPYIELAQRFGATIPSRRLEDVIEELLRESRGPGAPAGTTDALLALDRRSRE